jgi:hypothetical protein
MSDRARRRSSRRPRPAARRALLATSLWLAGAACAIAQIVQAAYDGETTRYAHGVLGDAIEYETLRLTLADGGSLAITLPQDLVFEDIAPRLADLDGDGTSEVITVESHQARGARLAVYDETGRIAATPFIGTRFRWLAPVGAADLEGDGRIEIAYIDRPHLAKTLRIWRYDAGRLTELAAREGLTNHRIGEDFISGGIRTCDSVPEIVVADAGWTRLVGVRLVDGRIDTRDLGPFEGPGSFAAALACP